MMRTHRSRKFVTSIVVGSFLTAPAICAAGCNASQGWFSAPREDVKIVIGYEPENYVDFNSNNNGYDIEAYPRTLAADAVARAGKGRLSVEKTDAISYYESDGKGRWRICRLEQWWPPSAGDGPEDRAKRILISKRYVTDRAFLTKQTEGRMALTAKLYFMIQKGVSSGWRRATSKHLTCLRMIFFAATTMLRIVY